MVPRRSEAHSRGFWSRAVATIAALALGLGALVFGSATAAQAAPPDGVSVNVQLNGTTIPQTPPGPEVRDGDALRMQLQYDSRAQGASVNIELGPGVTFNAANFPNNDAIESITPNGTNTGVIVKFKDAPYPVPQGLLNLDLTLDQITASGPGEIEWSIGDDDYSVPVVFVRDGDEQQDVTDGFDKALSPANLNSFIVTGTDGVFVDLNPAIMDEEIEYTLTINTADGTVRPDGFTVADALDSSGLLEYVSPLTVTATETTWDSTGYVPTPGQPRTFTLDGTPTATTFSGHIEGAITGPSVIELKYKVRVADYDDLKAAIQASYNALNGAPGGYGPQLTNTGTFGGDTTDTATLNIRGSVVGPCIDCGAFGKSDDLTTVHALTQDDGVTLLTPVDINYTLRANLAQWDGHSANFTLNDNVVITDTLLPQAHWNFSGPLPVTGLYSNSGTAISALTSAGDCPTPASGFAADGFVGQYCFDSANANTLRINVGKYHNQSTPAVFTNATIVVPAQLTTVDGLPTVGTTEDGDRYRVRNTARFDLGSRNWTTPNVDGHVVVPDAGSTSGVNDPSAFIKTAPGSVSTAPDTAAQVPYTFTVNTANAGVPAGSVRIVDYVDTRYFDIDAGLANVTVSGTYNRTGSGATVDLLAGDFDLVWDDAAETLTVTLSTDGQDKVNASASGRNLEVTLTLTTRVLDGKETIDLRNRAEMFGAGDDPLFWSQFESRGTSFGSESESRKHIFDTALNGGEWTQLMVPDHAPEDIYIYRLQFIGHGGFGGVMITPEKDVLPAGLEFVGFLEEADIPAAANPDPTGPFYPATGNLVATFDGDEGPSGTITLSQIPETTFTSGATVNVYFAARITDDSLAVINSFGPSNTTIVPNGPSIDIEKWIDEGTSPQYDQNGRLLNDKFQGDYDTAPGKTLTANKSETTRFTVSNDGPEPLIDIEVGDQLDSGAGAITGLVCTFPDESTGTTWAGPFAVGAQFECEGTLPALKAGQTHANTAWVTGVGQISGISVGDNDEWHGRVPTQLESTGGQALTGLAVLAGIGILGGGLLMLVRRRKTAADG